MFTVVLALADVLRTELSVRRLVGCDSSVVELLTPNRGEDAARQRGAVDVVQWLGRSLWTRPARVQSPWEARIIRCKNLALYIRDCESLCLSDETLKAVGPFYLVSMTLWLCQGK